jgi:RecA-family ATPase
MSTIERGRAFTAADLAAATFPPPRWAVRDLLAEGVNLLCGPPKLGKSWLALSVALSVAAGGIALGSIPTDEGDVLYLALEDHPRRLQSRMASLIGDAPAPPRLTFLTEWPGYTEGWEYVGAWLSQHPDARMVVVDVLQKVRPPGITNQGAYAADYGAMAPAMQLAREHEVCFVVVHHTRKQSADDFMDTVSGTNGIAGSADATLVLARSRNAADGTLSVTGRDIEERSYALAFSGGLWTMLDGPVDRYALSTIRRRVIDVLTTAGPMAPKALSAAVAHDYEATKKLMQRMAIDGQVETDGSGRYSVPTSLVSPESPTEGHQGHQGQGAEVPRLLEVVADA